MPRPLPNGDSSEFDRLRRGESPISLERVAFELAGDAYPDLDPAPYRERLDALADRVRQRSPRSADTRRVLGQVRWVLHVEEGFRGDLENYHDPANSYLNEVIDRKLGIPISLSLVTLAIGERLGLPLAGVGLPAHFMLRILDQPEPAFIDAFDEGRVLDLAGCEAKLSKLMGVAVRLGPVQIAPCTPKAFVSRMLRNLREIHLGRGDFGASLPILRRLVALDPGNPELRREWGVVALRAGAPGEAIGPLESAVEEAQGRAEADDLSDLLRLARRQQAERN